MASQPSFPFPFPPLPLPLFLTLQFIPKEAFGLLLRDGKEGGGADILGKERERKRAIPCLALIGPRGVTGSLPFLVRCTDSPVHHCQDPAVAATAAVAAAAAAAVTHTIQSILVLVPNDTARGRQAGRLEFYLCLRKLAFAHQERLMTTIGTRTHTTFHE